MMIGEILESKKITQYRLSKESNVPYTTINDICNGKAQIKNCSAETIYRISKALGVSMESLIEPELEKRLDFELFKSNTCHRLKQLGDIEFLVDLLEKDHIRAYYNKKWFAESLYLLAMLDYLSKENEIALCNKYDDLRKMKLERPLFPASVLMAMKVAKDEKIKEYSLQRAIPEFLRFNIVESEVRNVI